MALHLVLQFISVVSIFDETFSLFDIVKTIIFIIAADRVYWADADLSTISSCRLDGTDRRLVIEEPGAMLVGVDISPPYLYYVGRNKQ